MPAAIPFNLPFTQASKYFARKVPLLGDEYDALPAWAKQRAFTMATVAKAEIMQDIFDAVHKAIDDGVSQAEFNAMLGEVMDVRGWTGTTPWHAENVLRTNSQQAYGSGRLDQARAQKDDFPYWLFVAVLDSVTTPECEDLNGTVFPIEDVQWWPPIHFECRSGTESLSQQEAEDLGIDPDPDVPDEIDFDGPGAGGEDYTPDLDNLDDALAKVVQGALDAYDPNDAPD